MPVEFHERAEELDIPDSLIEDINFKALAIHLKLIEYLKDATPELTNLTTEEAAIFLRCSKKALESRRVSGDSVKFVKDAHKVFYRLSTLLAYVEENTKSNTCK